MMRINCILDCDSPSYLPEEDEYWQCGCKDCREHIRRDILMSHSPVDYLGMVRDFHIKYNHFTSISPRNHETVPYEICLLRTKLINEEAEEFEDAVTTVNIADAIADLLYVVFGAALAYGIPIEEIFVEVHRSNMTKSMEKDTKSIKGKTIKGPDWEPPNIEQILNNVQIKDKI